MLCGKAAVFRGLFAASIFTLLSYMFLVERVQPPGGHVVLEFKDKVQRIVLSHDRNSVNLSQVVNYSLTEEANHNVSHVGSVTNVSYWLTTDLAAFQKDIPRKSSPLLPRLLDTRDYKAAMDLMVTVQKAFAELNITWSMYYGTLLGSYLCHDILPWDDDLDILVEHSGIELIKALHDNGTLLKNYGLKYFVTSGLHKVFAAEKRYKLGNYKWTWPFVDMIGFHYKDSRLIGEDRIKSHIINMPMEYFMPLHMRPLSSLWLPSPRDPWAMLSITYSSYGQLQCKNGHWNHLTENGRGKNDIKSTKCDALAGDYPFVWRKALGNGTLETLAVGGRAYYSTFLNEPFHPDTNPFTWIFKKKS